MFDMSMGQEMTVRVTPALLNLANLLTLPTMDLQQIVEHELAENPALEEVEASDEPCPICGGPVINGLCLRCIQSEERSDLGGGDTNEDLDPFLFVAAPRSLKEQLLSDLHASLPEVDYPIAEMLVESLTEQGFLTEDLEDIAETLGVSLERVLNALQRLQELGPPGIATRDERECLLAQVDRFQERGETVPHLREMIEFYLEDLAARRDRLIARELHIKPDDVAAARHFIREKLWPYPLEAPQAQAKTPDRTPYRIPDLAITEVNNKFVVEVLNSPRRLLRINPLYQSLSKRGSVLQHDEKAHVQEYITRARSFLANLQSREEVLHRIGESIVDRQSEFLRQGVRYLQPMTRAEIAAELGVHESTISRAVADKTLLLPNRTLTPLSELFVAARSVQDVLRELITNEKEPLSDQELADMLSERGFAIARRTVAKYREQMNIPPARHREKNGKV